MRNWLKRITGPAITTVLGILVYVMFLIPATLFYYRLGTTPSEVGFTYLSVLARAVPGLVVALVFLAAGAVIAFYAIGSIVLIAWGIIFLFLVNFMPLFIPSLQANDGQLDPIKFKRKLRILKFFYRKPEPAWPEVECELRRRRELQKVVHRTDAQQWKIEDVTKKYPYQKIVWSFYPAFYPVLRRLRPYFYGLVYVVFCFLIVGTTVWAGRLAVRQADEVRRGNLPAGSELGLLLYQVETVYVRSASTDTSKTVSALAGKPVFMLGQNSEYVIIYVPKCDATVRIPAATVTISNAPTEGTAGRQEIKKCSDLR